MSTPIGQADLRNSSIKILLSDDCVKLISCPRIRKKESQTLLYETWENEIYCLVIALLLYLNPCVFVLLKGSRRRTWKPTGYTTKCQEWQCELRMRNPPTLIKISFICVWALMRSGMLLTPFLLFMKWKPDNSLNHHEPFLLQSVSFSGHRLLFFFFIIQESRWFSTVHILQ